MARYIGSICKRSRRVGTDLFLKSRGVRDISTKCKLKMKPGQHGMKRKKTSDYSNQLNSKQMLKYMYGVLERQFVTYYKKSCKSKGETGIVLLQLLERRLDNVVYRMGFASTRAEARQMVVHKLVMIKKTISDIASVVSIPSYLVDINNVIVIREKALKHVRIKQSLEKMNSLGFVHWVDVNIDKMYGLFLSIPERKDLSSEINEKLVVELYSK